MCSTTNKGMHKVASSGINKQTENLFLTIRRWPPAVWIVIAAVLCATELLEVLDLTLALAGAGGYMFLQYLSRSKRVQSKVKAPEMLCAPSHAPARHAGQPRQDMLQPRDGTVKSAPLPWRKAAAAAQIPRQPTPVVAAPGPVYRQPSSAPVKAPTFAGVGWDAEVQELLGQLAVTPECEEAVRNLARDVERAIKRTIPEIEVAGFTFGNPLSSKAFGVAVPEIDVTITISEEALLRWTQLEFPRGSGGSDIRRSIKSAIRACTDNLVSSCGFKFRRSAFRGDEPKVTLLAPLLIGGCDTFTPADIYVNAVTPLRSWTLLSDCTRLDVRARELVLLVRRWARDRGLAHVAKGHMSPYTWSVLAMFFLQVATDEASQLLPPFAAFPKSSRLAFGVGGKRVQKNQASAKAVSSDRTVADLFKDFMCFYATEFDWRSEAVSMRKGLRAAAESLAGRRAFCANGASEMLPCVEDAFDSTKNLAAGMTGESIVRLREELSRAHQLCTREASLSELLEPWAPPEREEAEEDDALSEQKKHQHAGNCAANSNGHRKAGGRASWISYCVTTGVGPSCWREGGSRKAWDTDCAAASTGSSRQHEDVRIARPAKLSA